MTAGGVAVASACVAGGLLWMNAHHEPEPVNSNGGSIALGTGQTDNTVVKGTTNMSISSPTPLPNNAGATPQPTDFSQYEQYKSSQVALFSDLTPGTGATAAEGSKLTVNYRGWLTTGQVFDESYTGGKPFSFTLGEHRVISGWEQGLTGMKVGGKRRLVVPPAAGYGNQATGPIPAGSVLVFDVELLGAE
jgi:FKBP-type peptidyl-prolyl cis-trans isomerase FkpA